MGPKRGKLGYPSIYSSFIDYDDENLSRQLNAMFQHNFSPPRSLRTETPLGFWKGFASSKVKNMKLDCYGKMEVIRQLCVCQLMQVKSWPNREH